MLRTRQPPSCVPALTSPTSSREFLPLLPAPRQRRSLCCGRDSHRLASWVPAWVLCALANRVLHSPACDLVYACGCAPLWAGGWRHCNVHRAPGSGPRCPWCVVWLQRDAWSWIYKGGPLDSAPDQDGLVILAMVAGSWLARGRLAARGPRKSGGQGWWVCRGAAVVLGTVVAGSFAGFVMLAAVTLYWALGSGYPIWLGMVIAPGPPGPGGSQNVSWNDTRNDAAGGDSSGASFAASLFIGTIGGMLWSGLLAGLGVGLIMLLRAGHRVAGVFPGLHRGLGPGPRSKCCVPAV